MKTKITFSVILLLLINVASVFAQEGGEGPDPCHNFDIEIDCPLDTWVMLLVVAASLFAVFKLYHNKKTVL
jgi:hypothetical protein